MTLFHHASPQLDGEGVLLQGEVKPTRSHPIAGVPPVTAISTSSLPQDGNPYVLTIEEDTPPHFKEKFAQTSRVDTPDGKGWLVRLGRMTLGVALAATIPGMSFRTYDLSLSTEGQERGRLSVT